jgi:hypothetical protein
MKYAEAFPSTYLRGADLDDGEVVVGEISHIEMRIIGRDAKANKPVLIFSNGTPPIIVNGTMWRAIAGKFGDDSRDWAGQRVELCAYDSETSDGKAFRGLKVNPLQPASHSERAAAIEAAAEREAEAKEAAEAMARARRPKLVGAKPDGTDVPF